MVSVNGKRTGMVQRFVLIHERSIKELIRAVDPPSSWQFLKTNRFGDANRRGSPSRIEGLGSSIDEGTGEEFPSGFGQSPRFVFAMLSMARQRRKASQTPIDFDT